MTAQWRAIDHTVATALSSEISQCRCCDVYSNHYAFAALKETVLVLWGQLSNGTVAFRSAVVLSISLRLRMELCALKDDGSVVTWGSLAMAEQLIS